MNTKKITITVCTTAIFLILGWDVYVATNNVEGDTVSEVVQELSSQYPIIAALIGIILGHLFWPIDPLDKKGK